MIRSASVTSGSRLASIAVSVVIVGCIVRCGPMRILALVTLASIMAALFGGELSDPIGVPGIWFPFGIGVADAIRLRDRHPAARLFDGANLHFKDDASMSDAAMLRQFRERAEALDSGSARSATIGPDARINSR